jgi:hypothetical protein
MFTILLILMLMPSLIDLDRIDDINYIKKIPPEVLSFELAKGIFFIFTILWTIINTIKELL